MIGPLKNVTLFVEDQKNAVEFYVRKLDFTVRRATPMSMDASAIEVSPPRTQATLVLYPRSMMPNWRELKACVVFHCPDVEATCRELESRGVKIVTPPKVMPWGAFAQIADPDGNELGLTSQ